MNTHWNLDNIYTSLDSQEFMDDMKNYPKEIAKLNSWADNNLNDIENPVKKIEEFIILKNRLSVFSKLELYLNLVLSTNTTDEIALKKLNALEDISTELTHHETLFKTFIKSIDNLDNLISQSKILEEHKYFLKETKDESSYLLSPQEEIVISKLKTTGSILWQKQWEQLSSTLTADIEIDNEVRREPLSTIRNLAYHKDSEVRKKAYEAEMDAYKKIENSVAFALNGIKGEVITLSKLRGYQSPLEQSVLSSRMDMKILDTMWSAIKEKLPELTPYFKKKAELLGGTSHSDGLPFYDLFAPIGEIDMTFTLEQAEDFIIKNFSDFSKPLGDFAKKAFDEKWIDLMPQEGKVGGAFCEAIHPIKESRILTNFGGTFNDVVTLAHELGHAYHDTMLYNETSLNSFYPMPIAETASTLCETIVINAALKTATKEEALVILENDIQGMTQVLIDIYSRFLFEDELFKERAEGVISSKKLQSIMLEAQKTAYGDGLNAKYLHPYMWICKPHYYDADFNYYNFPYAFGLLLSKALYAKYKKDGDAFVELYDNLLMATGKNDLADVAKIAGFDLYSKDFWLESLDMIIDEIKEFINL